MTDTLAACCAGLYELPLTQLLLGDSFHPGGGELTRDLARMAVAGRGSVVLDLASGIGTSATTLSSELGCVTVGLDYSKGNAARAAAASPGLSCSFLAGSAHELPFANDTFDVVMCECALCTFADQARALSEAMRVLKPGGRIAISDMTLESTVPPDLDNLVSHVLCIAGARSVSGYARLLEDAGFLSVRHRDRRSSLLSMLDRIEGKLKSMNRLAELGDHPLPMELEDPRPTLRAAKEFIEGGGLSYAMITARRPPAHRPLPTSRHKYLG